MKNVIISLSDSDYETLEKHAGDQKDVEDVAQLVENIVEKEAKKLEEESSRNHDLTKEEEDEVKQRLKDLGYLD